MKNSILSALIVILTLTSFAQVTNISRCTTTEKMDALRAQDPAAFDINAMEEEQRLQDWITNNYTDWAAQRAVITIPVVVHIWANSSVVADARVYEQIQTLNEDYRKVNADTTNIPSIFDSLRADIEVEFCLASTDPNGLPTTGIVRETGTQPNGTTEMWDYTSYLNIYVYSIGGGTLGFTMLATSPNSAVHISRNYFGNTSSIPYNLGRTATHEVGHWLNLSHIWGDANCGNDFCDDTPTQQTSNFNCPTHPRITCNNSGDMFMNYMDYTQDNCMNMLSKDQKIRMIAAINTHRPGLLSSNGCTGSRVNAAFSASNTYILQGTSIDFTDQSTGIGSNWNYRWEFNGATPSSSTAQNPTGITYNTPGKYTVVQYIDSSIISDIEVHAYEIVVHDGTSGIEINKLNQDFTLFPNPTTGNFTIKLDKKSEKTQITISNLTGQTIYSTIHNTALIELDLTEQPNGVYFVKAQGENFSTVKKIQLVR